MKINANKLRSHVLEMIYHAQSGHIGGSFSIADIVAYLFSNFDLISKNESRDRLILSKGHAVPILYATYYELGLIDKDELLTFRQLNSRLQGHPDHQLFDLLDATTGSLGQGLSIAIGHSIASKLKGFNNKVFCILGDGEMQEGQVWEALMYAAQRKLDNLICIIDKNGAQNDGYVDDVLSLGKLETKLRCFGWETLFDDGNNLNNIKCVFDIFTLLSSNKPKCFIANTQKGAGVSFMQTPQWHGKVPSEHEFDLALKELKNK